MDEEHDDPPTSSDEEDDGHYEPELPPTTSDCILALNNQAIELVQEGEQGDSRNAIKLLLEALSRLQSDLATHPDSKPGEEGAADEKGSPPAAENEEQKPQAEEPASTVDENWFVSLPMTTTTAADAASDEDDERKEGGKHNSNNKKNMPLSLLSKNIAMYEYLLDMHLPNYDPTLPGNRDGATALLLYNMGAIHHRMGLMGFETEKQQLLKSSLHLKKAANTYNMALSALGHWKKQRLTTSTTTTTKPLVGYHLLACAIMNNQWQIQSMLNQDPLPNPKNENGDAEPPKKVVSADHISSCLRETLEQCTSPTKLLSPEEFHFFSKNLQVHEEETNSKKRKASA